MPQNGFAPTYAWIVDQPATDQRGILLPADLPAGRYQITLRLYDPASGEPVDTPAGQDVVLGEVVVESSTAPHPGLSLQATNRSLHCVERDA